MQCHPQDRPWKLCRWSFRRPDWRCCNALHKPNYEVSALAEGMVFSQRRCTADYGFSSFIDDEFFGFVCPRPEAFHGHSGQCWCRAKQSKRNRCSAVMAWERRISSTSCKRSIQLVRQSRRKVGIMVCNRNVNPTSNDRQIVYRLDLTYVTSTFLVVYHLPGSQSWPISQEITAFATSDFAEWWTHIWCIWCCTRCRNIHLLGSSWWNCCYQPWSSFGPSYNHCQCQCCGHIQDSLGRCNSLRSFSNAEYSASDAGSWCRHCTTTLGVRKKTNDHVPPSWWRFGGQ